MVCELHIHLLIPNQIQEIINTGENEIAFHLLHNTPECDTVQKLNGQGWLYAQCSENMDLKNIKK